MIISLAVVSNVVGETVISDVSDDISASVDVDDIASLLIGSVTGKVGSVVVIISPGVGVSVRLVVSGCVLGVSVRLVVSGVW